MGRRPPILAVGSLAFDSIQTPFGKAQKILGGSVNHFSISASFFADIYCVSVVGEDFPEDHLRFLESRGVNISAIKREKGATFSWEGQYGYDLHEATTLKTCLNVFEKFAPKVPEEFKDVSYVFLGNIHPRLQGDIVDQMRNPRLVVLDTMNYWIESSKNELIEVLNKVDGVVINEAEARELSSEHHLLKVAKKIQNWGPTFLVIKRGEYGAVLFYKDKIFSLPGLPVQDVKDPTGAGDAFAGGLMGYLASHNCEINEPLLRKAVVYGNVMASFQVEDFGFKRLVSIDQSNINERYQKIIDLTRF